MKRRRGRPTGSIKSLLSDPGRFEIAAWLAFTEMGWGPYPAAYLTTFWIASDRPITTESVDDILLKSETTHRTTVAGHADRTRRKAPQALARATAIERAWLTYSAGLLAALVKYGAKGDVDGQLAALDMLGAAGWTSTLLHVVGRFDQVLRSNLSPADGSLTRTAVRLLRRQRAQGEPLSELFTDRTSRVPD
jgi:hypothetical protein